jgi:hypothetical protein
VVAPEVVVAKPLELVEVELDVEAAPVDAPPWLLEATPVVPVAALVPAVVAAAEEVPAEEVPEEEVHAEEVHEEEAAPPTVPEAVVVPNVALAEVDVGDASSPTLPQPPISVARARTNDPFIPIVTLHGPNHPP